MTDQPIAYESPNYYILIVQNLISPEGMINVTSLLHINSTKPNLTRGDD